MFQFHSLFHSSQLTSDAVKTYFTNFGPIVEVEILANAIFVIFVDARSAAKALLFRVHSIQNFQVLISVANDDKQKCVAIASSQATSRWKPPRQGIELLDMNDDCLREILLYLPVLNLTCVARTCKRLNGIATEIFETKFSELALGTSTLSVVHSYEDIKLVIRTFGQYITKLNLSFLSIKFDDCNHLLNMVHQMCKALEVFHIQHVCINRSNMPKLIQIISKLRELELRNCKIYRYMDNRTEYLFKHCKYLTKLKVVDVQPIEFIFSDPKALRNLESFTYIDSGIRKMMYSDFMSHVLAHENKLTKINLNGPFKVNGNEILAIAKNCPNVRKLYVNLKFFLTFKRFEILSSLMGLKKLKVACYDRSLSKFLNASASAPVLEYLELKNGRCDADMFEALYKYSRLRVLCLLDMKLLTTYFVDLCNLRQLTELVVKGDGVVNIVELIDGLPNLEILTLIESYVVFDWRVCDQIAQHCANRSKKLIIYKCDDFFDEMAQSLQNYHTDKFEIKFHPNRESDIDQ